MFGLKPGRGKANAHPKAKSNGKRHACNVLDLSKALYMSFGHGIKKNNPRKCIICQQPIRKGEDWRKYTSQDDPKYGRYSIIVHSKCG